MAELEKMKEEKVTETVQVEAVKAEEDDRLVLPLSKEYQFEDRKYTEIDLHGLEDLTAADLIKVNRHLSMTGNVDYQKEMSLEYACELAAAGTELPIEFFMGLKPKDALKLKSRVTIFLYGAE